MSRSVPACRWGSPSSGKRQSDVAPRSVSGHSTTPGPSQASELPPSRRQSTRSEPSLGPRKRCLPGARSRGSPPVAGTTKTDSDDPNGSPASSVPRKASWRPSGDHAGVRQAPGSDATSLGAEEPSEGSVKMRVRACRSASGPGSLANATCAPSGDQTAPAAERSPERIRRARAPILAGATQSWECRSSMPLPSRRQSRRRSTRASGALPSTSGPTAKRGSGADPVSSRLRPSGESAKASTPCASEVSFSATPPESATRCTWRSRRKSTWRPSAANAGALSSTGPSVSARGRPPCVSTHQMRVR